MIKVRSVQYVERQAFIQFYKNNREKIKVHRSDRCYLLCRIDEHGLETPLAAVKFAFLVGGFWLLRNMLVANHVRGQGVGHQLLNRLLDEMRLLNAQSKGVYCFPWRYLTPFYCQHGFLNVSFQDAFSSLNESSVVFHEGQIINSDVVQRFHNYRRRGLDISLCRWREMSTIVVDDRKYN